MTHLLETGQRLLHYLQRYVPEFAEEFNPGISRAVIQNTLELCAYELPENFYELYEWRNGHPEYFTQPLNQLQFATSILSA